LSSETQDCLGESDDLNMQWEGAKFLLRVTEEHKLTHNGVDNLCDSIQWLVDRVYHHCSMKLSRMLPDHLSSTDREKIIEICDPGDIFAGLKSRYLREKYYDAKFNYVVSVSY